MIFLWSSDMALRGSQLRIYGIEVLRQTAMRSKIIHAEALLAVSARLPRLDVRPVRGLPAQRPLLPENALPLQQVLLVQGNKPVEHVLSKNLREVVPGADIVQIALLSGAVQLPLIAVQTPPLTLADHGLEGGGVFEDHCDVHVEEHRERDEEHKAEEESGEAEEGVEVGGAFAVEDGGDFADLDEEHLGECEEECEEEVEEEEEEELAVVEADAVVDPGAVVVHVEHALAALRAVVAPFRLEVVAHLAELPLSRVLVVQPPQHRHASRVRHHHCHVRPQAHRVAGRRADHPPHSQLSPFPHEELEQVEREHQQQGQRDADEVGVVQREILAGSQGHGWCLYYEDNQFRQTNEDSQGSLGFTAACAFRVDAFLRCLLEGREDFSSRGSLLSLLLSSASSLLIICILLDSFLFLISGFEAGLAKSNLDSPLVSFRTSFLTSILPSSSLAFSSLQMSSRMTLVRSTVCCFLMTGWLMNLGRRSASKVASRKREMLSKRKRKAKQPNLCFTNEVLLRLFERRFSFVSFSSFCASSLWFISSRSSLFIFDFRLHSQRFRQCLPNGCGISSQYFSAFQRFFFAGAYSLSLSLMYPSAASQQAEPRPHPSCANSAWAAWKNCLASLSLPAARQTQALRRSRLARTRCLPRLRLTAKAQPRQLSMEAGVFLMMKRMVMQQTMMRSMASRFWMPFSDARLRFFLASTCARMSASAMRFSPKSFFCSSSRPSNSNLKRFSQNLRRGYFWPMKSSSRRKMARQLSSSTRKSSCARWLYCELVPTNLQILLMRCSSSAVMRSWQRIFSSRPISCSTSVITCGWTRQQRQPAFSMHCTSEWPTSRLTTSFQRPPSLPPEVKIFCIISASSPFGSRLSTFTISLASRYLCWITFSEIRIAVATTRFTPSRQLVSRSDPRCSSEVMFGCSRRRCRSESERSASSEAVRQMASGWPLRNSKKEWPLMSEGLLSSSSRKKSSYSCLVISRGTFLKNSARDCSSESLPSSQRTSEQQSICLLMEQRLVKMKTTFRQCFMSTSVSRLNWSLSSEAMIAWQLSSTSSSCRSPSSRANRTAFSPALRPAAVGALSKNSRSSTSYTFAIVSQRASSRQTTPSRKALRNCRQRTSSRASVLLPSPACPTMVRQRRFLACTS